MCPIVDSSSTVPASDVPPPSLTQGPSVSLLIVSGTVYMYYVRIASMTMCSRGNQHSRGRCTNTGARWRRERRGRRGQAASQAQQAPAVAVCAEEGEEQGCRRRGRGCAPRRYRLSDTLRTATPAANASGRVGRTPACYRPAPRALVASPWTGGVGGSHDASAPPLAGGSSYTDWRPSS